MKCFYKWILSSALLLILSHGNNIFSQSNAEKYNRFQYHNLKWKHLPGPLFHLYYPEGYDSICKFASVHLLDILTEAKKTSGLEVHTIPNFILYPSIVSQYETNVGLNDSKVQSFPTIKIQGSRVVVSYDGSYREFRSRLSEAVVRFLWEETFRHVIQESDFLQERKVPSWFKNGAIQYFANGWPLNAEEKVLELLFTENMTWEQFNKFDRNVSGQAFCYFLSSQFQHDVPKQLLRQLKQGKSLARAVKVVCKTSLDSVKIQCIRFYINRAQFRGKISGQYLFAENDGSDVSYSDSFELGKWNEERQLRILRIQRHSESYVACVTEDTRGVRAVHIFDMTKNVGRKQSIQVYRYQLPPWINVKRGDRYPLISWPKNGIFLFVVAPENGKIVVRKFQANGRLVESRILYGVDGVMQFDAFKDDEWILAAYRRGQSDIVAFKPSKSKYRAITDDIADNSEFSLGDVSTSSIIYRSGYPSDSLSPFESARKRYGLYQKSYSRNTSNKGTYISATEKNLNDEEQLLISDSLPFEFHDPLWINNKTLAINHCSNGWIRRDTFTLDRLHEEIENSREAKSSMWIADYFARKVRADSLKMIKERLAAQNVDVIGKVLEPNGAFEYESQQDSVKQIMVFQAQKTKPYIISLHSAYFSAGINNDYFINRYQPYEGYLGSFKFPEIGALFQGGFNDLFENHHFNFGYRIPSGMEGSDFFLRYLNTKRRLDWHLLYFRKVESVQPDEHPRWQDDIGNPYPSFAKIKTSYYQLGFAYPLHYDWTLSLDLAIRKDKTVFPAVDEYSLEFENLYQLWNINTFKLEANKLRSSIPMLYKGWKATLYVDGFVSHGSTSTVLYGSMFHLNVYQPLVKNITLQMRSTIGKSGGSSRILYNFGGVENNIVPRLDTSVSFPQYAPYAFQYLVTPLRGYRQNSLFGSEFALANVDVYLPFVDLVRVNTSFSMINSLQLALFMDAIGVGRKERMLPPFRSFALAYGIGARTMLAGYGLRFDLSWPGNFDSKPVWYLSLVL